MKLELINERTISIEEGWGVDVLPIWNTDDDDNPVSVSEIVVSVVRISTDSLEKIGGFWCVKTEIGNVPVENFKNLSDLSEDDTHDLRTRWFATEKAARAHAENVERRFRYPHPWESFVQL